VNPITRWLARRPLITDGAWGTQLQVRGLAPGTLPDTWNLEYPERVDSVARGYVDAGSEVILTNTFRSNTETLSEAGLAGRLVELNRAGVEISRRAAAGRALVFASLGPTGKRLSAGEVTAEAVTAAFTTQAHALADAGADALLLETFSDLEEARLAVAAAKSTGLPVVASFAFDVGQLPGCTMTGTTPEDAAKAMQAAGADALGANCGTDVERFVGVCRRLKAASTLPIWIKANAGLPKMESGVLSYTMSADRFASYLTELTEAGAAFVGGCCGTGPDFVAALRRVRGVE
jgi:methionine synthase I (cobalamin-dependent)